MLQALGIGFTSAWLLALLALLPVLWLLLRAIPPAPIRRAFPGVALLLGLADEETETDRTPWWLLLIRTLAAAAIIIGFAGPILNPRETVSSSAPLLVLSDSSWASARDWNARVERIRSELQEASRLGRTVALIQLTSLPPPGEPLPFRPADEWLSRLGGMAPSPWTPVIPDQWAEGLEGRFDTIWMSDGLERDRGDLLDALSARGDVLVIETGTPVLGLRRARFEDGKIAIDIIRSDATAAMTATVNAIGPDPAGTIRTLAQADTQLETGQTEATVVIDAPPELRNRFSRFEIAGIRSAGTVSLSDDALKRREVALFSGREDREGLQLLSPTHYLRQALAPSADILESALADVLPANPDVIVLADVATLSPSEADGIRAWVEGGGLLVRFAGPRLASSDIARSEEDPLLPVRLRAGGRSIGGAMSWGDPRSLRAFQQGSPFYGLDIPDDVQVTAQVLAQPDPTLAERTIATLDDGTPLVTRKQLGAGSVVLFHVTANAEWSSLPLSGLFVDMLERLAISTRPSVPDDAELEGTTWQAEQVLDAFGALEDAGRLAGIAGEELGQFIPSPETPPGLYAGPERRIALNVIGAGQTLAPSRWPPGTAISSVQVETPVQLKGHFLAAALALLLADILAALWISGRLSGQVGRTAAAVASLGLLLVTADHATAQQDASGFALEATSSTVLAFVETGDDTLDRISRAGLTGLSDMLYARTSVEPANPLGVNLETDELAFFPLLYWPVSADQPIPSDEAYAKLNRYLRNGGMIVFDTRDADIAGFGGVSPNAAKLRSLALPLDIPPLEIVPPDHILTRTFYLLQDFPGRHASRDVWVEAAPANAEQAEGMPFRNLNDNVTPVLIGGNDWASAWAVDAAGNWMFPVGRGMGGERQREIAFRFGINLVMHVLTGNYKSDQVHVPALLDRLGQ